VNIIETTQPGFPEREPYVTKAQVAAFYGFTPRWVETKVAESMPCYRFGRRVRFRMSEVEAWLRAQEPPAQAA
jgi:excisionase family DNA binding protein